MNKICNCSFCNKEFVKKDNRVWNNVYCSRECFLNSKRKKTEKICSICSISYMPKHIQKKESIVNTCPNCRKKVELGCPVCNTLFTQNKSRIRKRKNLCCSVKCKSLLQKKDWNDLSRNTLKQRWIKEFGIENFICNRCGHKETFNIVLHHIIYVKNGGTNNPENLVPLCLNCHGIEHYKNGIDNGE